MENNEGGPNKAPGRRVPMTRELRMKSLCQQTPGDPVFEWYLAKHGAA